MKTIYISGKITGTTDYEERFDKAEKRLKAKGYKVANPVLVGKELEKVWEDSKPTWDAYMTAALLSMLGYANTLYMLRGWEDSRGARLEHHIATELGYDIMYEEEV